MGLRRRFSAPEGKGVLDQRMPARVESLEHLMPDGFLARDRAGRDREVQPRGPQHPPRSEPTGQRPLVRDGVPLRTLRTLRPAAPVAVEIPLRPRAQLRIV